jgi:hypothetical protein
VCVLAECSRQFTGNSDFISADPTYFTLMPPDELNIYREGGGGRFFFFCLPDSRVKLLPVEPDRFSFP